MNFDYDIEHEDGTVLDTVNVDIEFDLYSDVSRVDGVQVYLGRRNITGSVDELYGEGTYAAIMLKAKDPVFRHQLSRKDR